MTHVLRPKCFWQQLGNYFLLISKIKALSSKLEPSILYYFTPKYGHKGLEFPNLAKKLLKSQL